MNDFPTWLHILRLLVTFLFCAGMGIHAYASFNIHSITARKWMFFLYSLVFLFTSLLTLAYLMVSAKMGDYSNGPVKLGTFNMLLIFSYLALNYEVGKRKFFYMEGQDQLT